MFFLAHTISQRLRRLRQIPPELVPLGMTADTFASRGNIILTKRLGIVVAIAVGFGVYSLGRKVIVDKQMRLSRQNRGQE